MPLRVWCSWLSCETYVRLQSWAYSLIPDEAITKYEFVRCIKILIKSLRPKGNASYFCHVADCHSYDAAVDGKFCNADLPRKRRCSRVVYRIIYCSLIMLCFLCHGSSSTDMWSLVQFICCCCIHSVHWWQISQSWRYIFCCFLIFVALEWICAAEFYFCCVSTRALYGNCLDFHVALRLQHFFGGGGEAERVKGFWVI